MELSLTDPLDLTGKVGFVTGGTRGIGLATVKELAGHGANIVIGGRTDAVVSRQVATDLRRVSNVEALGIACDSADPEQIREAYRQIRVRFGRLDFLVNNAGVLEDALIGMITDEMADRVMAINATGLIHHTQGAARLMRKNGGSIVNMTSIIGVNGNVGQMVYGASKAAVIGMTKSAAKELAPKGIRVNAIAPGFIETDMTAAIPQDKFAERLASVKMSRIGKPQDIANAVLFCVSDLSTYMTGQVIGIDGGMLI